MAQQRTAKVTRGVLVLLGLALGMVSGAALAQTYPAKPIRILVPLAPGGLTDIMTRVIGQKLTETWGQPVIVDNRPGASGMIASDIVAKAAPDGHTLITVSLAHAVNASIYPKLPYDTIRDFTPVIYLADTPQLLLVRSQVNAAAPEIPTIAESGFPGYESRSWYGMLAPAKLPKPVLAKLHGEIARIITSADFGAKFAAEGVVIGDMTPEQFAEFVRREVKRYAVVVKAANLQQ